MPTNEFFKVRGARVGDLPEIVEIYNQAVRAGFQTADLLPWTVADKGVWFKEHSPEDYPILVAECEGVVRAWASVSPYRPGRLALKSTVEWSYYVHQDFRRKGLAKALLDALLSKCCELGYKQGLCIVLERNVASLALLEKLHFQRWAFLPDVAEFDGVRTGHVYMGVRIQS
ncbi:MAG: N-acetyltransferase [Bacteroidia bacterium]|nr:N-acetyltransferase [Bacteroidia bacterium]